MSVILGSGDYRYRVNPDWAKLPDGWNFTDVAGVAVDGDDRVYVLRLSACSPPLSDPDERREA